MTAASPLPTTEPDDDTLIHPEQAARAAIRLRQGPSIDALSKQFALMADPTRLRLLIALSAGELCVNDLAAVTGVNRSTVSHQLKTLRDARLVRWRRDGKIISYALDDDHVVNLIALASEHLEEVREEFD